MKKKAKITQSSTVPREIGRNATWWEAIVAESLLYNPTKEDWRKQVIHTMYQFFNDPEYLYIEEFCMHYKIPFATFYRWCDTYDDIKKAKEECMRRVALYRKRVVGKYNPMTLFRDLHVYEPSWIAVEKFHADLKKAEDNIKGGIVYVHAHEILGKKED